MNAPVGPATISQPRAATTPAKSSPAGGPRRDRQFAAAAEAICRRLSREITDPPGTVLNAHSLARLAPEHAALENKAVRELSGLNPPAAMTDDWHKILAYRRTLATDLVELGKAAKANNSVAINNLGIRKKHAYQELATLVTHDGLSACGKAGLPSGAHGGKPA